ncbi:MAG: aminotransferase class V-fold PLP-dependent enzyme [Desulfomonile tiedjei]|uniref:cysteine desulfurase n=1 Tax=Desulfomonile tiedjei TaxID=2358 RepID=A0A9D6V4U2_9BACT|nr:aminotransferase class V-fold PLP-dependent enzyme [Desulfomonile tiedjei]
MDDHSPMIYLDNAATTFPKPLPVLEEMFEAYARLGVSPGRSSYDLAVQCEHYVYEVRHQISNFFGGDGSDRVVFAYNATDALNTIILGLIEPECHVVSSRLEHNSVLRPLHHLRDRGLITFDLVPFDGKGFIDPRDVADLIKPATKFVILNHVSNVLGTIQPVSEVGRTCADRGIPLILDASQSAGVVPINMRAMNVHAVAFTGHKSLLGPTGIGGLVLREGIDVRATRFGGTGFESWDSAHPEEYPYRLEAGTLNVMGIIGLSAGLRWIAQRGMANIYSHEMMLARTLRDGLSSTKNVRMYCADRLDNHVAVLTCNVENLDPEDFAAILDGDYNVATRSGLHCAPLVHEDIGTSPRGGVRFSVGPLNSAEDISAALSAVGAIVRG